MTDSHALQHDGMNILDTTCVPLTGVSLIEASAGTGKTYTITSLYVRWVLGHGCVPRNPENILVVTFTRAATEELRDRIRRRLRQAYLALQGEADDPLIDAIKHELTDLEDAKQKLKDAQQLMDLAAIYTIHGFAQRLLRQNAVESGLSGEFELVMDESELLAQAVRDVWRAEIYPLSGESLQVVLQHWKTPDGLLANLRSLLYKDVHFHTGSSNSNFTQASEALAQTLVRFRGQWDAHHLQFIEQIQSHPQANGSFTRYLSSRVNYIQAYLDSPNTVKQADVIKALEAFSPTGMLKSVKKGGEPIDHDVSVLCESLLQAITLYDEAKTQYLRELRQSFLLALRTRLQQLKQQQDILSTDDLLKNVNIALQGANRDSLLQQIRHQYPVAMVDEFQDTDGEQYQVFHRLYAQPEQDKTLALFMIGDPKQAIYKFRGADIFTYIQAKKQVDSRYTLDTNYRSTKNMVDAVNTIFTQHDHPFIYDDSIPFLAVNANDSATPLTLKGEEQSALSWVMIKDQDISTKSQLTNQCAESCAEQISVLLNAAQNQQAHIGDKPLAASDLAVLVRNRHQAAAIKHSLSNRGISCVYVGQESVFESGEAQALFALMQGVHGLNERQYRNALAYPIWSLSLHDFSRFQQDEAAWEVELEHLYVCHDIWSKQGIMAMVMHWLHIRHLPNEWLALSHGERRLTNMMHLAELLQESATQVQGMQGLLTWFSQQIVQGNGNQEGKQLRLESDANLVHIITIHKSKGLEYPVVFLPFNWEGKASKDELFYDETHNRLVCDLTGDYIDQRIKEGLAEEVRLLYVGLTRAASKCFVSLPDNQQKKIDEVMALSALHHVVFADVSDGISSVLAGLQTAAPQQFEVCDALTSCTAFQEQQDNQTLQVKVFNGKIARPWQMSSFSSLVRHLHGPISPRFETDDVVTELVPSVVDEGNLAGQFRFPKGAHAGNFLHTLLESIDFTQLPEDLNSLIESLLARFGIDLHCLDDVPPWLHSILHATMNAHGGDALRLCDLQAHMKKVEMEFYFPVETLNAKDVNTLLSHFPCVQSPVQALDFSQLKGMLKGFIDLTFTWKDQYFILDYKSNHLGNDFADYQYMNMDKAMAEHRYDVQLIIYTLALHRLLKLRLPNYDYDKHIGGGYYLFLRGLSETGNTGQFYCKPEKALIFALDALMQGETIEQVLAQVPQQGDLLC